MMNIVRMSLLMMILLFAANALGETAGDQALDLIHADKIQSSGKAPDIITNLIGHVHLKYGETQLWSERAIWYKKTDVAIFIGSVVMTKGPSVLTCQTLTYYRVDGSAQAIGGVLLKDTVESLLLTANKVDYLTDSAKFIATGGPLLKINPEDDSSRVIIDGDSIIYDTKAKTGDARHNVVITRRDIRATCDNAQFLDGGKTIILTGNPVATQDKNVLTGDMIKLFTEKRTLVGMLIEGAANATYRTYEDTAKNLYSEAILTGKQLEVFFAGDKPEHAVMRRNATSHYTPSAADSMVKGENTASGDSITLFFEKSKIVRVLIIGGAQGQYVENKLAKSDTTTAAPAWQPETTFYNGQQIDYLVDNGLIELLNSARLKYQATKLESAKIKYNTNEKILIAEGIPVKTDSGETLSGAPVLFDGTQQLDGRRMTYNIDTRKGKVEIGRTEYDNAYYKGKKLREVSDNVLFVSSGEYTSCDLEYPHFHFYCQNMKMITQDKIIARPVVMFIGPVPVMALPYYVFPIRKGRHSGFLTFDFGSYKKGQRFIHNLGYYWAPSDYWDGKSWLDLEENGKLTINGQAGYALRYRMNGSVTGSYTRQTTWNKTKYQRIKYVGWSLNFGHNQTLSPTMSLKASGGFTSSKNYNLDNSYDPAERLVRTIKSSASLSKRWQSSSLSGVVDQSWNLDTDEKTQSLPSLSYSRNQLPLFPSAATKKELDKRILPWEKPAEEPKAYWYNSIYFSFRSDFQNKRRQFKQKDINGNDILDWRNFRTLNSQANLSAPQKILGVFNLAPTASIIQTIYKIDKLHKLDTASVSTNGYFRREVWNTALGLSTTLYGTVYPRVFQVTGLRHVMTPSLSYGYSPKIDRNLIYARFTGVGSASSKTRSMRMSLSNLFQMKTLKGESENKYDLFSLDFSSGYNFEAKAKKWGDLSSSLTSSALKVVNISAGASHSFYDEVTGERRLFNPRLQNVSFSMSFNRTFRVGSQTAQPDTASYFDQLSSVPKKRGDFSPGGNQAFTVATNLSYRYGESRSLGAKSITRWIEGGLDINLTAGWRILYNFHYDIQLRQFSSQELKMSRDLHCWQGEFVWIPTGSLAGYYFRISIKKHPDIKVEQSSGRVRAGYY
jgi:lipopolysaccharide assembly outer membrane protein LptD (OstA)